MNTTTALLLAHLARTYPLLAAGLVLAGFLVALLVRHAQGLSLAYVRVKAINAVTKCVDEGRDPGQAGQVLLGLVGSSTVEAAAPEAPPEAPPPSQLIGRRSH